MLNNLHKSPISKLEEQVDAWAADIKRSRETVADCIVQAHEAAGREASSKITFLPNPDEPNRMAANCMRIFRWLDDAGKEKNLLNVNFLPSILLALPKNRRDAWLCDYLRPLGLGIRNLEAGEHGGISVQDICDVATLDAEAMRAMSAVVTNPTPDSIDDAVRRITAAREKKKYVIRMLEGAKRAMAGTRSLIGKLRHKDHA